MSAPISLRAPAARPLRTQDGVQQTSAKTPPAKPAPRNAGLHMMNSGFTPAAAKPQRPAAPTNAALRGATQRTGLPTRPAAERTAPAAPVAPAKAPEAAQGTRIEDLRQVRTDALQGDLKKVAEEADRVAQTLAERLQKPLPATEKANDGQLGEQELATLKAVTQRAAQGEFGPDMQRLAKERLPAIQALEQHFLKETVAKAIDGQVRAGGSKEAGFVDGQRIGNGDGVITKGEVDAFVKEMQRRQALEKDPAQRAQWAQYATIARLIHP